MLDLSNNQQKPVAMVTIRVYKYSWQTMEG